MTKLLLKTFVPNYNDTQNVSVRQRVGKLSGIVGIVLNVLLACSKIAVGLLFGVVSAFADGNSGGSCKQPVRRRLFNFNNDRL